MKIELIKNKLQNAVIQAERLTSKSVSLPILTNILLEAVGGRLTIKATNLEIGLEIDLPVKSEGDFSFAVNPSILNQTLQNISGEEKIILEQNNDTTLTIKTPKGLVRVKTVSSEDFPIIPRIEQGNSFKIPTKDFIEGIKAVAYAAALSDIKPEISSVYMYQEDTVLTFVATDSFRLSEKKIITPVTANNPRIIIPLKNALEIIRILGDHQNTLLEVGTDANQITLITDGVYITSRIIDGVYPDYRQIMPKSFKTTLSLNRDELISTLKLAGVVSDKFNRLSISIDTDSVTLSTKNSDVGESELTIKPLVYSGESTVFTLNSRNILDTFQSFTDEVVVFGCNESTKPLCIKGEQDQSFTALVMPLRS